MKRFMTFLLMLVFCASALGTPIGGGSTSDKMGAYAGTSGAGQSESNKASLDLAHTDLDTTIQDSEDIASLLGRLGLGGTAKVWYVDSAEATGTEDGTTWATATDTLDEAIILALADTGDDGDLIIIAAGHAESLTATDDVDFDVAGIIAWALGVGENRATFTYTTNGELVIGTDDVEIHNFNFIAGPSVTHAIDIEAGAENYVINNCRFWTASVNTDEFIDCIDIAAGSDNGKITNCEFELGAASAVSAISHIGSDFTEISGNLFTGDFSTACIEDATTTSLWMIIDDNILVNGDTSYTVSMTSLMIDDVLFTVAGGPILITSLVGEVTTVSQTQANDIKIALTADNTFDHDFSTSVEITGDLDGDRYTFDNTTTESVLVPCTGADGGSSGSMVHWYCSAGDIILDAVQVTHSGAILWYMTFTPLAEGVTVTPQ